ncbi:MAG: hypothetical protein EOM55_01925 [Clostridia bacterium]|nr:hypothetical protein [Clostridia bacterium]
MNKKVVKFSGILTVIISLILFLSMAFLLCYLFELITGFTQGAVIAELITFIFIYPIYYVFTQYLSLDFDMLIQLIAGVFALFTLVMMIWGIKEISLAKKDDESFARCKKSCAFMMMLKFLFFAYNAFVLIFSFVSEDIALIFEDVNSYIGVQYISQIIIAVLCVITLLNFLIPVVAFSKASKFLKNGGQTDNFNQQNVVNSFQNANNQGEYQKSVYQAPYYNAQQSEPLNPSDITHPVSDAESSEYGITIIPGQDGVPYNITQKGIDDLIRLERLRASGTIDEQNYTVMKEKICRSNIS